MAWYADFEAEFRALVAATWTECTGVYTSVQTSKENLLTSIDKGRLTLPFAIVQIGKATADDERGLHNRSYRCPVSVLRLSAPAAGSDIRSELARMDVLAAAIERTAHTSFRAIEQGDIDGEETNATLASMLNAQNGIYACTLAYSPGLLSGVFAA